MKRRRMSLGTAHIGLRRQLAVTVGTRSQNGCAISVRGVASGDSALCKAGMGARSRSGARAQISISVEVQSRAAPTSLGASLASQSCEPRWLPRLALGSSTNWSAVQTRLPQPEPRRHWLQHRRPSRSRRHRYRRRRRRAVHVVVQTGGQTPTVPPTSVTNASRTTPRRMSVPTDQRQRGKRPALAYRYLGPATFRLLSSIEVVATQRATRHIGAHAANPRDSGNGLTLTVRAGTQGSPARHRAQGKVALISFGQRQLLRIGTTASLTGQGAWAECNSDRTCPRRRRRITSPGKNAGFLLMGGTHSKRRSGTCAASIRYPIRGASSAWANNQIRRHSRNFVRAGHQPRRYLQVGATNME